MQNVRTNLICVFFFSTVMLVFWPALQGNFLTHDDYGYVSSNPHVNTGLKWGNILWSFMSIENSNWHPLTWLSHMLDVEIYGSQPWGHHLTSLLIHAVNSVIVFLLFLKMSGAMWRSLIIAGLFALHPLDVQSVAWICERKNVLSTLFWLLATWAYLDYGRTKSKRPYIFALTFLILGLMSKTMLVSLPIIFLLLDFWPLKRWNAESWKGLLREKIPFFIAASTVGLMTIIAQKNGGALEEMHLPLSDRIGDAFVAYVLYLGKLFWPANLCVYYPNPGHRPIIDVLASAALLVSISFFAIKYRARRPYFFFGWFWFLIALLPVINVFQSYAQSIADRYTYVPMLGLWTAVIFTLADFISARRGLIFIPSLLAAAALVSAACITRYEIKFWKDDVSMWNRTLAVTKNNYMAEGNLGMILYFTEPAQSAFHLNESVRINPNYSPPQIYLASQAFQRSQWDEGISHLEIYLKLNPNGKMDRALLDLIESTKVHVSETVFSSQVGPLLLDQNYLAYNNFAWLLATSPDSNVRNGLWAVRLADRACAMTDYRQTACIGTLAAAYAEMGKFDDAVAAARKAIELATQNSETHLLQKNQELLALYLNHQPYRDSQTTSMTGK